MYNITFILMTFAAIVAGILIYRFLVRYFRRAAMTRRFRRGAEGEDEAATYLEQNGYSILQRQAKKQMHFMVDGKQPHFDIIADFIAKKRGKTCLVEVKTGSTATNPACTSTRRQLLEYAISFDVDKILLFDADTGSLHEIVQPTVRVRYRDRPRLFFAGIITGMLLVAMLFWSSSNWIG